MIRVLRLITCSLALLLGAASFAVAQTPADTPGSSAQRLDGVRASLEQIEQALTRGDLADPALQDLRARLEPLSTTVQTALDELTPRQDAMRARLDQLGPKPGEKAPPEAPAISAEREELQRQFDDADAAVKRARILAVRLEQASTSVLSRRREIFTGALFARNYTILSPELWIAFTRELPRDARAVSFIASDWWSAGSRRLSGWSGPGFFAGIAAILLGFAIIHRLERRVVYRDPENHDPSAFAKSAAAIWIALSTAAVPMLAMLAFVALLRSFDLVNGRLDPIVSALLDGVARISITLGIARGLLAPDLTNWRLLDLRDHTVDRLARLVMSVAILVTVDKLLESVVEIIGGGLPISIAIRGVAALVISVVIAAGLHGIASTEQVDDDCLGPPLTASVRDWYGPMRFAIWIAVVAILGAIIIGYVAFAAFLIDQIVWITFIGSTLYLLMEFAQNAISRGLQPQAPLGRALLSSLGLRRESLDQLAVLLTGLAHLGLIVTATMLALAPWGIESDDMTSSLRAAFFGFKVGEVTVSLSSIIIAVVLFGVAWGLTRGLQRWLETSLMPHTQLDTGLRNSIRTSISYVGFVVAAAISLGYLGLSFDKIAIVAGALSVGIGFGLQSIVNNFVSGLILLWERAIRVGDWIVVGDEQGYVRRINVRSTEIETFDRATMIVPNLNLVTGVVKNWVRTDKVGRIKVPVAVNITADPEKVRDTLIACARTHELVIKIPAPTVFFLAMADNMLKFELVCFVADVETSGRVKSDLNFEIFRQFREAGFDLLIQAAAPTPVSIVGLDRLEAVLDRAAGAKARS